MELSIFPKAKALPASKDEKQREAKFTSKPHMPVVVKCNTDEQLIDIICNNAWSPSVFSEYRNQSNFLYTDFMVLDIDDGMTIDEAMAEVEDIDLTCLCMPSTSHTDDEHRFRLIFPLLKRIDNKATFSATMEALTEHFPADPSCIGDTARFFFGAKPTDGFFHEGDLLEPQKPKISPKKGRKELPSLTDRVEVGESLEELVEALYGEKREEIPEQVAYWLEEAPSGLHGEWHNTCNSAIFTLGLQGVAFEVVEDVFRTIAPDELDDHDEYLLERAWHDGYNSREEEE
jgi:hypothetical protein